MQELVELRATDGIEDTILMLEHEPVITRGRGLQWTGSPRERHTPLGTLPRGVAFAESERGGDLTAHVPGQLVIYPICRLGPGGEFFPRKDVAGFVRALEQLVIDVLASYGVAGDRRKDATGVWVSAVQGASATAGAGGNRSAAAKTTHGAAGDRFSDRAASRKVASIGVAVRKWVTWHGAAVNVVNSLDAFKLISPCGFSPEVMTRLGDLVPLSAGSGAWRANLEARIEVAARRIAVTGGASAGKSRLSARASRSETGTRAGL